MPINLSLMGTAPDNSASTTNIPKGAFAHPTGLALCLRAPPLPPNLRHSLPPNLRGLMLFDAV
uniref:Uncharacterized protein n=1 Tax=Candidatus Kentrum sp. DK TaxID=2126562 RepID=A0A450SKD2_9GAMM|nr:MAG: hypothetical protein BECKDK2373C_GA0170839_104122 [Candidatus Kentron sp. DK]